MTAYGWVPGWGLPMPDAPQDYDATCESCGKTMRLSAGDDVDECEECDR